MTVTASAADRRRWADLAQWSESTTMTDSEAVMWRAERHPWLSSTIVAVELLDRAPDWKRLRAAHEWGSALVSRFRQRVVDRPALAGPPLWREDPEFDLDYHLRRVALPAGSDMRELLDVVQQLAMVPLDRQRPLWEATLIEGLPDGAAAYVLKSHHSLSDGLAGIQLLSGIHSRRRGPTESKPAAPVPVIRHHGGARPPGVDLLLRALPRLGRAAPLVADAALRPVALAARATRLAGSIRRVATTPGATPSPLLRDRSGRAWRFAVLEVALADLKAAGRVAGGTVTDVYLAALLGGLARFHARRGRDIGTIPVAVPVSLRRPDDPIGGNRFTAATIAGPASIEDPAERLLAVRAAMLAARAEPALALTQHAAPLLSRLPAAAVVALRGAAGASADLAASSFPGLTERSYIAGARVNRTWAFGPLPGAAVMATLVSHEKIACIALNCDGAVIPDADELAADVQASIGELLALVGGGPG